MWKKRLGKKRIWLTAICAAAFFSITAPKPATTQTAIALEVRREMNFGEFAASVDGPGTVVLSPTGDTVSASGPVILFSSKDVQRARIKIVGDKKTYVIVSLPSSITIKNSSSNQTMTVSNFTMDVSNPVYLGKNGQKIINIGATLTIGTNQQAGDYDTNNSFTFVVEYL